MVINGMKALRGLVIDDVQFMRQLMGDILRSVGVGHVDAVANAADGLKLLGQHEYHFAFVDWELEQMSGLEFVRKVRQPIMGSNAYLPIIMVTSHSEEKRVIEARDAGIHEYLIKPFTAKNLLQRLQTVINSPRRFIMTDSYFGPELRSHGMRPEALAAGGM